MEDTEKIIDPVEVTEEQLDYFHLCQLISLKVEDDRIYNIAVKTLNWAISEAFKYTTPTKQILREKYNSVWKSTYYPELVDKKDPITTNSYWEGPSKAAGIASKIHDLLMSYEVIHPVQNYVYTNTDSVHGAYALLRRRTSDRVMVLIHHDNRPLNYQAPRLSHLVRYLHAKSEYPLEKDIGIQHLCLLRGESWKQKEVDEKMAYNWFQAIKEDLHGLPLPRAGSHCSMCLEKACTKVFNNG